MKEERKKLVGIVSALIERYRHFLHVLHHFSNEFFTKFAMLFAAPVLDHTNNLIVMLKASEYFLDIAKLDLIRIHLEFNNGLNNLIDLL